MPARLRNRRWLKMVAAIMHLGLVGALVGGCTWFAPPEIPPENLGDQPIAVMQATPDAGTAPLTVRFDASSSYDPAGDGLAVTWFFGDGSRSNLASPTHTYGAGGEYEAILIIEDSAGRTSVSSVAVEAVPQAATPQLASAETDDDGVAVFPIGDSTLTVHVSFSANLASSTARGNDAALAGLNVSAVQLGTTLAVSVWDDQEMYAPSMAVETLSSPTASLKPEASRADINVILYNLGAQSGVLFSIPAAEAIAQLRSCPATAEREICFEDTAAVSVRQALLTNDLVRALRLDSEGAAGQGSLTTPYALYLSPAVAQQLHLAGPYEQDGVAVIGYGDRFLSELSDILAPVWRQSAAAVFSIGVTARGVPVPGTACLQSLAPSGGLRLTAQPGNAAHNEFACQGPAGTALLHILWYFGDDLSATGAEVTHTYSRPGSYEVSVSALDSSGYSLRGTTSVSVPFACPTDRYGSQQAILYADRWALGRNSDEYFYNENGDCANFVSQCLLAGGVVIPARYASDADDGEDQAKWNGTIPSCTTLHGYLADCLGCTWERVVDPATNATSPAWFRPGDVAIVSNLFEPTDADYAHPSKHTLFAIGYDSAGQIVFASHTPEFGRESATTSDKIPGYTMKDFLKSYPRLYAFYYHMPDCLRYNSTPTPPTTPLDAPQLEAPSDGATSQPLTLNLQWAPVTGANKYWVLLATESSALPTNINATTCSQCLYKTYTQANQLAVTLESGKTYFWRVQGFNDSVSPVRQGNYSEIHSFSTLAGPCTYSFSSYEQPFTKTGGNGSFSVTTGASCAWTATTDSTWVTLTQSGSPGSGAVNYSVLAYSGTSPRTGHITVQDKTFTITQAGDSPCSYSLSSYSQAYTDAGSHSAGFSVNTEAGCAWTATVAADSTSWVTASASTPTGSGTVNYSIGANPNPTPRTGRILVQDKTFTITQPGKPPVVKELDHITVSGPSIVHENTVTPFTCTAYFTDTTTLDVTASATWSEDSPYATVSGGKLRVLDLNGDSSCVLRASYTDNNGINKWTFWVVQLLDVVTVLDHITVSGPGVVDENSSADFACTAYFGDGASAIVTGAATWTCASSTSWGPHASTVTIVEGRLSVGSLDGDDEWVVTASYTHGTSTRYDAAALHLHDTTPPPPPPACTFEVGPTTAPRVAAQGGSGVICVRTSAGCQWAAAASDSWIHVTTGKDYTGNGDVGYTVDLNPGAERSGTITAAGKTCTIPQSQSSTYPPVARLTMSAQGRTAYEGGTLNLTMSGGQTIRVQLSAARSSVDTGTPIADWSIDGGLGSFACEAYWDFSTVGTHLVRLSVINSDGHTSASAEAQVVITAAP